jgi:hypothetical protein
VVVVKTTIAVETLVLLLIAVLRLSAVLPPIAAATQDAVPKVAAC